MLILNLANIVFTSSSDVIDGFLLDGRLVQLRGSTVDTLTGSDILKGKADSVTGDYGGFSRLGVYLQDSLTLGPETSRSRHWFLPGFDNDVLIGEALNTAPDGGSPILLFGILIGDQDFSNVRLATGLGNDEIRGTSVYEGFGQISPAYMFGISINNSTTIETGVGNDTIAGSATGTGARAVIIAGLSCETGNNLIATGGGRDTLSFEARSNGPTGLVYGLGAFRGALTIATGDGQDSITGFAETSGLVDLTCGIGSFDGKLVIDTGGDSDIVTAQATFNGNRLNGFFAANPSEILINLGSGADKLKGFGNMTADGGSGMDIWDLRGYSTTEFTITKTDPRSKSATFSGPQFSNAIVSNFEVFCFDDGIFSYGLLPDAANP